MIRINGQVFCAKCGKPVDRMVYSSCPPVGDLLFTVYCHGEQESTVVTFQELASAISVDATIAFQGAK